MNTLLVLIFTGTYFRGDINDRISRVHIYFRGFAIDMLQKILKIA